MFAIIVFETIYIFGFPSYAFLTVSLISLLLVEPISYSSCVWDVILFISHEVFGKCKCSGFLSSSLTNGIALCLKAARQLAGLLCSQSVGGHMPYLSLSAMDVLLLLPSK